MTLRLIIASCNLEGDQVADLQELYRLHHPWLNRRPIWSVNELERRRQEQAGACQINGIAQWRINLVAGATLSGGINASRTGALHVGQG